MTTLVNFRNTVLTLVCITSSLFFIGGCKNEAKTTDSEEVAEDMNKPKDDATRERDEEFMMKTAEMNLKEIALGKLAQQKATNADVKAMGKMMEETHKKVQADLEALAGMKSIAVPKVATQDVQDLIMKMSEKSGMDFDKDYCDNVVSAHKDAVDKFENASNNAFDPDIKAWASGTLGDLRAHLTNAMTCRDKLSKM
ncbi:MAG: DUF4142 domain-containing protein [Bacteroidota bacterium]|nr:DUF4142 domain-containing protein [Bacteroidota bacterium]